MRKDEPNRYPLEKIMGGTAVWFFLPFFQFSMAINVFSSSFVVVYSVVISYSPHEISFFLGIEGNTSARERKI